MIYLMRHGQDDETYVGGWSDVSLIPKGKEEVKEAEKIRKSVYSILRQEQREQQPHRKQDMER